MRLESLLGGSSRVWRRRPYGRSAISTINSLLDYPAGMRSRSALGKYVRKNWSVGDPWRDAFVISNAIPKGRFSVNRALPMGRRFDRRFFNFGDVSLESLIPEIESRVIRVPNRDVDEFVETSTGEVFTYGDKLATYPGRKRLPWGVALKNPWLLWECLKRKARREVMFAENKAGKLGQKPARRTPFSGIEC